MVTKNFYNQSSRCYQLQETLNGRFDNESNDALTIWIKTKSQSRDIPDVYIPLGLGSWNDL